MIISKYSSIIPLENNHSIVYNSVSDKFIILKNTPLTFAELLNNASQDIITKLLKINAIFTHQIDETKMLEQQIAYIDNDASEYHLHVNPTLNCNFKCWYCYENHIVNSKMSGEIVRRTIAHAHNKITNMKLKRFQLSFFGGEPFMYFDDVAKTIISKIAEKCRNKSIEFTCHFTTNGALLTNAMVSFFSDYYISFQITLDGHRSHHDKVRFNASGGSYNTIINNVLKLANAGHRIILRINYTSENINSISDVLRDIAQFPDTSKSNITIDFQRVWQDTEGNYNSQHYESIDSLMKMASTFGIKSTEPFRGNHICNSCYGDKRHHILINYNGDAYFCTARDFKHDQRAGDLDSDGNIIWRNNALEKWMNVKFKRQTCRECRIAGICGGGCRQKSIETSGLLYCPNGFTEQDKNNMILSRLDSLISLKL